MRERFGTTLEVNKSGVHETSSKLSVTQKVPREKTMFISRGTQENLTLNVDPLRTKDSTRDDDKLLGLIRRHSEVTGVFGLPGLSPGRTRETTVDEFGRNRGR